MCRINEEMVNDAKKENSIEIATGLIEMGSMNNEDIARLTKLSLEEVQSLASQPE